YQELKRYPSLKPQGRDAQPPAPTVRMDTGGGENVQFPGGGEGGAPGGGEDKKGTPPAGGNPNPQLDDTHQSKSQLTGNPVSFLFAHVARDCHLTRRTYTLTCGSILQVRLSHAEARSPGDEWRSR